MLEYRVTKYDPARRDASGAYQREEWSSFADIGRSFGGEVLTAEAYERVEDAYVATALSFWREVGKPELSARGVEAAADRTETLEGSTVDEARLDELLRRLLREELWCRLESATYFLHVGWDYYAYVGVPAPCPASCALAASSGLFVEAMVSPHHARALGAR